MKETQIFAVHKCMKNFPRSQFCDSPILKNFSGPDFSDSTSKKECNFAILAKNCKIRKSFSRKNVFPDSITIRVFSSWWMGGSASPTDQKLSLSSPTNLVSPPTIPLFSPQQNVDFEEIISLNFIRLLVLVLS